MKISKHVPSRHRLSVFNTFVQTLKIDLMQVRVGFRFSL